MKGKGENKLVMKLLSRLVWIDSRLKTLNIARNLFIVFNALLCRPGDDDYDLDDEEQGKLKFKCLFTWDDLYFNCSKTVVKRQNKASVL